MFSSFSMGWLSPLRPASSTRPDSAQLVRLPQPAARQRARQRFRHQLLEQLEPRLVMDSQWQNPARPLDVNNNGIIAPLDALLIIDKLNRDGTGILPPRTNPLDFFYDTSGDSVFSPRDALLVINHLNEVGSSGDPRLPGESETAPAGFISLPLTQLAGTAGQIVRLTADMTIGRIEFNEMGLFVVDDAAGNIRGVPPSSSDYPRLAFEVAQRRVLFSRRDVLRLNTTVDLPAGQHLRVYVLQAATSDGDVQKHLRVRDRPNGVVRVGWEEHASVDGWVTIGDRGFDDVFVDMQFSAPSAVNSPPVLPSLPDRTLPELTTVTFDVTAFDAELPADQIRYTLDVGPTGAVLNSTNGIFTWTPTEAQGPGIFPVVIRATDSSGAFDTETITISVLEVNLPPSLAPLADVTLRPGDLWQATAAPSDADLPANRLSFELGAGAPAGLTIDSSTGVLRFTAPLTDRNATYPITVTVRDNGQPNLSASRSFTIRVIAQRTAPVIDAIPNQTIPEMIEKVISVTARDLDLPDDSLLYVLVSGPNGLTLDEVTGQVRWTPTEAQGPGVFPVTVRAIDRDGRSDVESFTITVTEVNRPPVLESIGNFGVIPGQSVSFTARAADPDLPANSLTYSVSGNVPPGFNFNASTGQFNWTAAAVNETTRYDFLVHVTDNGLPSLADSEPVTITVASTVIDLVEDDRFVTEYRIPVTIGIGIAQLQLSYDGLRFDRQDADSINDAFEVALVDANSRPVVGIITPNRDGFYNRTEEWTTLFGSGTTHTSDSDGDGGVISLDVSHLPAGYQATMVVRLVNNDSDNTTRVQIVPRVTQVPGPSTSASLATPSAWAASLNVLSRTYDDTDWRHLADVTASTSIIYDYTAYDIDSGHMGTGVTLRNTGNYPIRGPLLISVSGITSSDALLVGEAGQLPRDPGKFSDSTIASLAGSPFFDATQSLTSAASPNLTSAEPGSALLPGESVRLLLEFQNRSIARFDYQIHVMGTLNRTPEFDTQAPSAVRVGNVYRYDSGATDPDKDTLKYSLVSGPSGLTIDALTGMIVWTPTVDDVGTHAVTIDTVDPFGASDTQRFTIDVVDASAINRPPVFITDPIIDAYVGVNYQYASRAADPDFDALTYAMIVGPTGMSMLAGPSSPSNAVDPAGNLSWTPPATAAGTYVPVTLQVEDGRGGSALQSFRIYVHPNPVNLPPVIVTTPQIDFDWAGPLGAASGVVTPQVIELDLGVGDQAEPPVTVRVPPQLPMVDVFLLFDDTGSFASRAPQLARAFPQVIDRLRQALPNVDLGFGVGRFEDYGGPAHYASSVDRPFVLNQPIFPASTVGMRDAIVQALSRRAPGGGGDGPESLIEALYQVATGLGFDGNNDGNALESGLAGMLRTQTAPGDSGDVPPFLPGNYDVFRAGAIPLPLNTTVNVPAINSNSTFAFKFTVQPGEAFQFQDSASSSDTSQWLVVNQIGRIVGVHRRGQTFIESFDTAEELLLIPRTQVGTTSAATMTRIPYQPPTEPLVFGQDNQFSFAADGERRRYTFTLTEPTAVIFDGIMADERTTWSLHDGTGNVFSSRIFGQPAHSDTFLDISPFEPGDPMAEGTVDQTHVLTAGNYVLTIRGLVSSTPTLFQATKFPPTGALPVVVGATISVPVQQERIRWVRVDGQTGQGFQVSHRPAVVLDADGLPLPRMQIMDEPSPDYGSLTFGQKPTFWLGLTSSRDETLTFTPSQTQSPASLPTATPVTLGTLTSGQLTATTQERHYEIVSDRWQWIKVAAARSSISWGLRSAGGAGWYEDPFSTSGAIPFLNQEVLLPPGVHRLTLKNAFFGFGTPTDFQFTVTARPFIVNNYTFETGPDNFAPFGPGARGGAGFRAGAIPIVLAATDTGTAYQPDGSSTVSGINNVQLPLNDLLSASRSETAGGRGASVQQAINALVQQGALVIGLGTNTDANVAPRKTLEAISKLTGATNAGTTALDSNISSDPIAQGDPLYFLINDNAVALANGVAAAIEAAVKSAPTNVNLRASDTTAGFTNRTGQKNGVRPDSIVQFETRFIGDGQAHVFDLQFIRPGSSEIIGSIPVAINDRYRYDSKAIDPDDDPVTLELIGENHGAQFDAAKGTIRWRPAAPGSYSFTLRASDPLGGEDIQSWTVTVGDLRTSNAEPVLAPLPPVVVSADTAMRLSAVATDQDAGDQLRYAFLGASVGSTTVPAGLTIDSATGQIDWIPTLTQVGQTRVIVRVTDARGGFDDQPLVIEVVPPAANNNRLPNITTQAIRNSVVDRHYLYDVDADDLDHDPLTYSLVIAPRGMVIDHTTGVVAWNPRQSDLGMHDVLLKVSDNMGGVVFQGYQLFVSQTNDPPEITSRPESVAAPGSAWNYQVLASDPNGDVLRYSLVSGQNPTGANIDASTGLLTWTPTATGAYRFSIEVSDGRGGRARQEFTLPVTDAAPPNIVSVPRGPARVGQLYEYLVVAVDPNANETVTLSLDATSIARGASLTATGCPAEHSNCAGAARLVWTPNSIGDFPIAITATDPTGNSVTQSFTLAVVQPPASSQPPVITSRPTGPALKNQLWSYAVTAVDPDGDPVTYRLGQAPAGMSIDRTTGLVNWTPGEVSSGVIVEVVAEDARGAWSMQAFDLPVVERINNAAPIFTSVPTGPGIVGQTWNYVASAFDPDGDIVSYELDAAALAAGLIISSSSGLITWTPRTSGQQTLIVTAKDAYGGVATQTITLPIQTPPNAPPMFISVPTGPALVGRAWLYAARATDPDGDTLRYSLSASTPATVTIDGSSGRVTFTPDSVGSVDITVFATDTAGNRAEQSFRLPTVAPPADGANRPPVFTSTPLGPARVDQAWIYQALASDADGDPLTYILDSEALAAGVTIESNTGRIQWTPRSVGTQTITVSARDVAGNIATQRFDLLVVRDNRAPVIESEPTGPVVRGRTWTYPIITTDPDGDTVTLSLDAGSVARGVTLVGQQLSWTPTETGSSKITLTASDGRGGQATQVIHLNVVDAPPPSGHPPRFRSLPPKETPLGQALNYRAEAFDPDGTSVRYVLVRGAVGMSIDAETGALSWRPEQLGQVAIEIAAIDEAGERTVQAFTLSVVAGSAGNQPPEITSQPRGPAARHVPYQYPVQARDPDGDVLTYTLDAGSLARGMTITAAGVIQWLPTVAQSVPVTLTVRDALGAATEQSFTLTVLSNAPPQITSTPPQRIDLGQTLSYAVTATDPNPGDSITYSATSVDGLAINSQSGLLTWRPPSAGRYTFSVFASDNHQARDEQSVELLVVDPANNQPPKIDGAPRTQIQFGVEYLWQVPASDPDGDYLTYQLIAGPAGLAVDARGLLRWTPTASQVTSGDNLHAITVRVSDGRGGSDEKTWRMAVGHSAGNQAPTIDRVQIRAVDYPLGGDVPTVLQHAVAGRAYQALFSATDPEGDTLVWSLVEAPSGMRIDARGLVDYRPTASNVGSDDVVVRVTDTAGASHSFPYRLTVRGGNSPARISGNPPVHHRVATEYTTTFTATDSDNDPVVFRFVSGQPTHGAQLDASTGKMTWTPATTGTYRFFVAAVDPLGEGTQLVFDVLVDQFGPNDPPRFEQTQPGVAEVGTGYVRRFPAIDPDGDALVYAIEDGPEGLSITASDGTLSWDAPVGLIGQSPLVKLTAKDPAGQTARTQFRLPVRAANTPPRFESTPPLSTTAGTTYRYDVVTADVDGDALTLSLVAGPTGLTLDAATGRISWTTGTAQVGTHQVKVALTDGRIAQPLEQVWTITVAADSAKPTVKLFASQTVIEIGTEVAFEVRASDNVAVVQRTLKAGEANIALSSSGFGKHTFTTAGRFSLQATASDAAGNTSTDSLDILVRDPNNAAPQLQIVSPTSGQQLAAPTDIGLSASDAERDLTAVRLLFAPADGSADFRQFAALTAASGQRLENFTNQVIGRFDPTNLANGAYVIRAVAEDAGFNQTVREIVVQVAGRLKLGNFAATFEDLTIPVSGMPITIVRSYDTLDAQSVGDFGNGWKLDIQQARVRIDASTLGGMGSGRFQAFVNGTRVIVTTPEGTEEGFTFRAIPAQTLFGIVLSWKSNFDPDEGNNYKLEAPASDLKQLGDEYLSGYGTTYNPRDPEFGNVFQVTSFANRITYNVNATTGETGSIQDRNDNKLTLRYDGIISSAGRSVTFQRDMLGRIVSITDPRGNSLRYGYDAAGDLVSFTDRMGNTVRMTYHAEPAHYLDTVIDPLGNVAMKASYKLDTNDGNEGGEGGSAASGRLARLEDATGSYTAFENNSQELRQTQRDEKGVIESVQYDSHGNPLEHTVRGGERTIRTFDDPVRGLPTTETQVIGRLDSSSGERDDITVRRTYNQWGQVTSETDSRGNVTRYLYNSEGVPTSSINPDGSSTFYSYDDKFNLIYTSSSSGGATSMTYDKVGQVTEVRSGDLSSSGNVVKLKYNRFGEVIETEDSEQNKRNIAYDANGNNVGTEFTWTDPNDANNKVTLKTSSVVAPNDQPQSNTSTSGISRVEFDTLNRPFRSIDQNGLVSETIYDLRGLAIETRTQSLNENGAAVWMVSRTVYDADGQAIYTTSNMPEGTAVADTFGTYSIFDTAGRVVRAESRLGVDIQISGSPGKLTSRLISAGRLIASSETQYDASGRAWQTIDNYGRKSQTLFDRFGQTIETRTQSYDENGVLVWLTSRSVYDSLGRVLLSTDRYLTPASTELGSGATPAFYATATLYDNQGRSIGSQRITGAVVTISGAVGNLTSAITARGTLLHASKTIYDARGRVSRSISPTGQITDYLYDARDRQIATISHPLAAEQVGLGSRYPGKMVRLRSETEFDRYGRVATQITNLIQVENSNGSLVTVDATDAQRTRFRYDAEGRQVAVVFPDGTSASSEYDNQGRVTAQIDPLGNRKEFTFNIIGQLVSVALPTVPNPRSNNTPERPIYRYSYNQYGQMSQLTDANNQRTQFAFDANAQSTSRTLPNGQTESFAYDDRQRQKLHVSFEGVHQQTLYDDSAIGGGRVLGYNLFANGADYVSYTSGGSLAANVAWKRIRMNYDVFGRVVATEHLVAQGATSGDPISTTHQDRWTNAFDDQGRLITTTSPTGFVRYQYDTFGRKTATESGTTGSTVLSEVTYAYDALSRLSTLLTVRRDGLPVDSDVTQIGNQPEATRYHFDLLGRPDYTELPNGVVEDYVFDNMDRLDLMQHFQSDSNNADLTNNALKNMFDYSYRADGKRVGLVERFDTSGGGIRTGSSTLTNNYTWTYDNAGRLVSEVLDSSDNTLDQTESFLMDLVGNRIRRTLDKPGTANDTTDIYTYDASDRLLSEQRYAGIFTSGNPTGSPAQTTTYTWNATQQTSKTVINSSSLTPQVSSLFSYGLSGQLERVITTTEDGSGRVTARTQVEYRYDPSGIRFISIETIDTDLLTTIVDGSSTSRTEFLIDHQNFTGYGQSITETRYESNAAGGMRPTKRITYTYGLDEITQSVVAIDAAGALSPHTALTFGHDGHGSTRVLFEALAVVRQVYIYSAYGELLAIRNSDGAEESITSNLTTLLYNGESIDGRTGLYNFRARWYSPSIGRFERLDPFEGNLNDPFSFNKYGFVHGDPVHGIDPSGLQFSLGSLMSSMGIQTGMRGLSGGPILVGLNVAHKVAKFQQFMSWVIAISQAGIASAKGNYGEAIKALVGIDPAEINEIKNEFKNKNLLNLNAGNLVSTLSAAAGAGRPLYMNFSLPGDNDRARKTGRYGKKSGKIAWVLDRVIKVIGKSEGAQEFVGEIATSLVAHLLGFKDPGLTRAHEIHGPDFMLQHGANKDFWAVVEAKGGGSKLKSSNLEIPSNPRGFDRRGMRLPVQQMGAKWIEFWLRHTIQKNESLAGESLEDAFDDGTPMLTMVVSLDLQRAKQFKLGFQAFVPQRGVGFNKWENGL